MHKVPSLGLTENLTRVLNKEIHRPAALDNLIEEEGLIFHVTLQLAHFSSKSRSNWQITPFAAWCPLECKHLFSVTARSCVVIEGGSNKAQIPYSC